MRVVVAGFVAFIIGFVLVYATVVAGALWYMHANNIFDRDGGISMGIVFLLGPLAGLIGGSLFAVVAAVRSSRRQRAIAADELPPPRPWPLPVVVVVALLAGVFAYVVIWAVLGIRGPLRFGSYGAAMAFWIGTIMLALAVAALVLWRGLRRRAR
jgi:hypothetical protein